MTQLSNYAENELLDHAAGTGAYTSPTVYLALSTTAPAEDGTNVTEPAATEYARQAITFGAASSRSASNTSTHTFTDADEALGTITHIALYDALTVGNMLAYGTLDTSRTVAAGEELTVASGAITITWATGGISTFLANELLDHLLGTGAYTAPDNFLALSTANPTDAGSGTSEPAATEYARADITFGAASGGVASNTSTHTFTDADEALGTITHWATYDASTAGNMLFYGAFNTSRAIGAGETLSIASADIDLTFS